MLALAYDNFGLGDDGKPPPWLEWAPKTLKLEFEREFGVALAAGALDRLMAGIAILTTDLFFTKEDRFIQLCNVLAGADFDPTVFDPADAIECAWGVTEALLLHPPDDDDPELFSDDVRRYIGGVLKEEGYLSPPDVLRIALDADFSAQVQYDYADDPATFQTMFELQRERTAEVESIVKDNLAELLGQLRALPLRHGDVSELEKRVSADLRAAAAAQDKAAS